MQFSTPKSARVDKLGHKLSEQNNSSSPKKHRTKTNMQQKKDSGPSRKELLFMQETKVKIKAAAAT